MDTLTPTLIGALVVAVIASITDIRTGKIYNILTLPAVLIGLVVRAVEWGMRSPDSLVSAAIAGILSGLGGCLVGMLSLGVFKMTIMRKFGGGDIKLMGALGAFTGPGIVFATFFYYCFLFGSYGLTKMLLAFPWRQAAIAYAAKNTAVINLERFNQVRKAPLAVAPFILGGLLCVIVFYKATMQAMGIK